MRIQERYRLCNPFSREIFNDNHEYRMIFFMFHVSRQAQHSQFTYYNFTLSQITEIKIA